MKDLERKDGGPATIRLRDLEEDAYLSCIDGRHRHGIVGAPGGNMGEFLLLLTASEAVRGPVDLDDVGRLLDGYLHEFGRFYMHTDRAAMDWIASELGRARLDSADIEAWDGDRDKLLELLTTPRGVGCGHLNAMLNDPSAYDVRPELIKAAIRAFFDEMWNPDTGARLHFEVLEGEHEEEELVVYESDASLAADAETSIPVVDPGLSRFVLHDVARRYLLERSREFFTDVLWLDADEVAQLQARLAELSAKQLEATRRALFPTLPIRRIRIDQ